MIKLSIHFQLKLAFILFTLLPSSSQACSFGDLAPPDTWNGERKNELIKTGIDVKPPRVFGASTKQLPPNYTGINPFLVWKILSSSQAAIKGEFETSQHYQARRNLTVPFLIKYGYNTSHPLPFASKESLFSPLSSYREFRYDIDTNSFILTLNSYGNLYVGIPYYEEEIWEDIKRDSFLGSNSFGASAVVDRARGCSIRIRFPHPLETVSNQDKEVFWKNHDKKLTFSERQLSITLSIPATPDQARLMKKRRLSLLYILKPKTPYIIAGGALMSRGTFSDPREAFIDRGTIYGDLQALFVVDKNSGKVLGSKIFEE